MRLFRVSLSALPSTHSRPFSYAHHGTLLYMRYCLYCVHYISQAVASPEFAVSKLVRSLTVVHSTVWLRAYGFHAIAPTVNPSDPPASRYRMTSSPTPSPALACRDQTNLISEALDTLVKGVPVGAQVEIEQTAQLAPDGAGPPVRVAAPPLHHHRDHPLDALGELAGTATGYAFVVHGFACLVCCLEAC